MQQLWTDHERDECPDCHVQHVYQLEICPIRQNTLRSKCERVVCHVIHSVDAVRELTLASGIQLYEKGKRTQMMKNLTRGYSDYVQVSVYTDSDQTDG